MHITNFDHPITHGLSEDLFWGTTNPIGPVFYLKDKDAVELGEVVHSMGLCMPGFGVKTFDNWNSILPLYLISRPLSFAALPGMQGCISTVKRAMCSMLLQSLYRFIPREVVNEQ
ncbi:MAG: hypothetical protein DRI98_11780 [Bacteroidetes bacterium]|nr:MAG: hypothetical protein DRI98_11780 [Bacteroidota bacterium]